MSVESLLRSIVDVTKDGRATLAQSDMIQNLKKLRKARLDLGEDAMKSIFAMVNDHYNLHQEVPHVDLLMDVAQTAGNESLIVAIERVTESKPWVGSNYNAKIREAREEKNIDRMAQITSKALDICTAGIREKKDGPLVKGSKAAAEFLSRQLREIVLDDMEMRVESQIISEKEASIAINDYDELKRKHTETVGIYTGLHEIDKVCKGLKHTELMITAGYVGQLKTTTSLNIAYKAIFSGWDGVFVTLEMTHKEIRDMIYILHTCNPMFLSIEGGRFSHLVGTLDFNDVCTGDLSPEQEEFYKYAITDFSSNPDYGRFYVWQPSGAKTTLTDVEIKMREVNSDYAQVGRKLDFAVVDYLALLDVEKEYRSRDKTENLTYILQGSKRICLTFNNGQGMRMLSPWQINRQGYSDALKNGGLYEGFHLANAAECERTADVIIASFLDPALRDSSLVQYCCIKNRRNPFFKPFKAAVNFPSRFIHDIPSQNQDDNSLVNLDF